MSPRLLSVLADLVLSLHVLVIAFNVLGLVVIPLGAWRGWQFVRVLWWRALHVASLSLVAVQAVFARACFLTIWQSDLMQRAGERATEAPLIERWVMSAIFWPIPGWAFTALYVAVTMLVDIAYAYLDPRIRF